MCPISRPTAFSKKSLFRSNPVRHNEKQQIVLVFVKLFLFSVLQKNN